MTIDASRALGAYAAVATLALGWMALGGVSPAPTRFAEIDVERINVREPDGTLRLAISNRARIPGIVVGAKEYPHPNRPDAGMIFYNDEGIENGGLVFSGEKKNGVPANGGSLTFDRHLQDQTVQLTSIEEGSSRMAGMIVTDRPDGPLAFDRVQAIRAMPQGAARDAAYKAGNFSAARRAFLGRANDGVSQLTLADAQGRKRLVLRVAPDGAAAIDFLDADGKTVRSVAP